MERYADGTPCPPYYAGYPPPPQYPQYPYTSSVQNTHPYAQSYSLPTMYEHTTDIEYTTELQAQVRRAKPRRRVSLAPSNKNSIAIHEDTTKTASRTHGSDFTRSVNPENGAQNKRQSIIGVQPRRRRVSSILADRLAASDSQPPPKTGDSTANNAAHGELKKEARRRTIYIPDDTTVVTIHPGASFDKSHGRRQRSPDIGFDLVTLSDEENEEPLKTAMKEKKAPRKSLAVAPKRAPLRQSTRPRQSVAFAEDTLGAGDGKENVPPGFQPSIGASKPKAELAKARLQLSGYQRSSPRLATISMGKSSVTHLNVPKKRTGSESILDYSPKATKMKMTSSYSRATVAATAVVKQTFVSDPAAKPRLRKGEALDETVSIVDAARPARVANKASVPYLVQKAQEQAPKYPVLTEDLRHPELYEDHWLHYQETALTQLLNGIFEPLQSYREPNDPARLRKKLLTLYHEPQIPLLHRRIQASLQYGALSIPKDLLAKASRIKDDIGLRKKFLALFSETYDLDALRAACEVIVGREVSQARRSGNLATSAVSSHARTNSDSSAGDRLSTGSTSSDANERQLRSGRKAIERFLHTFLVKHEDAVRVKGTIASIAKGHDQKLDDFGSQGWAWRRTVLRSLMLILLLDKAKSSGTVEGCLFQSLSPYKTSAAVITALSTLILPSLGDIIRPLSHLHYNVETVQLPLEEYIYKIGNLATDLRDGVTLTRLVELVLFTTSNATSSDMDQTMTISMPSGEELTSTWKESPADEWILSKHLKFPCAGRPVKLYNVQLALCAVAELGGAAAKAAAGISAEDIVDGHREKTLSLLWAIVGNCGLESLVDWQEVKKETRYFSVLSKVKESITDGFLDTHSKFADDMISALSLRRCSKLLLAWAQSIGAQSDIKIANLTTSFADNKAFECIVDAYLPYFPQNEVGTSRKLRSSGVQSALAIKLKAVGSSAAFISLFSNPSTAASPIPSKSFTLTTLTFLASRLVPVARTHRAASTIQRAYRRRLERFEVTRRVVSMRLANHCAQVVQARERVVGAATVLQRAWRAVLDRRIGRLISDVTRFQSASRGWIGRETIKGGGKVRKMKVRGGW